MNNCLIAARYTMKADVYSQSKTRDPDSGQIVRSWSFLKTIECQATGIKSDGIRTVGSTEEYRRATRGYEDWDWVRLRSTEKITKRMRITNIRLIIGGDALWYDDDRDEPMRFELIGVQPQPAPFQFNHEYEHLLYRVQDGLDEQWI